jgi:hypothetical protein
MPSVVDYRQSTTGGELGIGLASLAGASLFVPGVGAAVMRGVMGAGRGVFRQGRGFVRGAGRAFSPEWMSRAARAGETADFHRWARTSPFGAGRGQGRAWVGGRYGRSVFEAGATGAGYAAGWLARRGVGPAIAGVAGAGVALAGTAVGLGINIAAGAGAGLYAVGRGGLAIGRGIMTSPRIGLYGMAAGGAIAAGAVVGGMAAGGAFQRPRVGISPEHLGATGDLVFGLNRNR